MSANLQQLCDELRRKERRRRNSAIQNWTKLTAKVLRISRVTDLCLATGEYLSDICDKGAGLTDSWAKLDGSLTGSWKQLTQHTRRTTVCSRCRRKCRNIANKIAVHQKFKECAIEITSIVIRQIADAVVAKGIKCAAIAAFVYYAKNATPAQIWSSLSYAWKGAKIIYGLFR